MVREIEGRPLVVLCLGLLAGMAFREAWFLFVFVVAFVFLFRFRKSLVFSLLGALVGFLIYLPIRGDSCIKHGFYNGIVKVVSMPQPVKGGTTCTASTPMGLLSLMVEEKSPICLGDQIHVVGVIDPPSEVSFRSFQARGLMGNLKVAPGRLTVIRQGAIIWKWAQEWRDHFIETSRKVLGEDVNISAEALCFNISSNMNDEFLDSLQRTGTIHIISASGLHVMIFAFVLQLLIGLLPIPRLIQIGALALILLLYSAAAGLEAPVIRSSAMYLIMVSAFGFRREGDLLSALSLVALVFLVLDPICIRQMGFQLSFLSVAALGLFCELPGSSYTNLKEYITLYLKEAGKASIVVSIATAPIVAYQYGYVSLISPLANLAIAVVIGPLVITIMACSFLTMFSSWLTAGLLLVVVKPLSGWIEFVVTQLAAIPFATVPVPSFSIYWLIPIYVLLLMTKRGKHAS